jgi:predicted kinase
MSKVILICGKIASGKTTYAKSMLEKLHGVNLSLDEIMLAVLGENCDSHDDYKEKTQNYLFNKAVEIVNNGVPVILDWGFWTKNNRIKATEFFTKHDIPYEWHYINATKKTLIENVKKRNKEIDDGKVVAYHFDDELAEYFWAKFEPPTRDEIDVWIEVNDNTATYEKDLFYHKDGFKHNRDGYTYAKTEFTKNIMKKAKDEK